MNEVAARRLFTISTAHPFPAMRSQKIRNRSPRPFKLPRDKRDWTGSAPPVEKPFLARFLERNRKPAEASDGTQADSPTPEAPSSSAEP